MRPDFVVPQKNGVCWSCRLWERSLLDLGLLIEPVVGVVGVAVGVVGGLGVVGLGVVTDFVVTTAVVVLVVV